ncbi:uncharacterized protein LOC144112610 [Amblyomma americanum]
MGDHNVCMFPGQSPPDEKHPVNHSVPSISTSMSTHQDKPTGKQIHQCTHCGKIFQERSDLVVMADHNFGVFPGQSPPDEQRLLNHSVPSTSTSVNTHRDKPTGKQIYQCTHCGNVFKKRSYLVQHIRTHTGDRPYHCSDCDSTFAYKDSLVRHLRTHTGDRPYRCDHCDSKFTM